MAIRSNIGMIKICCFYFIYFCFGLRHLRDTTTKANVCNFNVWNPKKIKNKIKLHFLFFLPTINLIHRVNLGSVPVNLSDFCSFDIFSCFKLLATLADGSFVSFH